MVFFQWSKPSASSLLKQNQELGWKVNLCLQIMLVTSPSIPGEFTLGAVIWKRGQAWFKDVNFSQIHLKACPGLGRQLRRAVSAGCKVLRLGPVSSCSLSLNLQEHLSSETSMSLVKLGWI